MNYLFSQFWIPFVMFVVFSLLSGCGEEMAALPMNPTTADIQKLVFEPSCIDGGCHDGVAKAGALDLSSTAISREQLLFRVPDNSAARSSGWSLVLPGDPEESFLVKKLDQPGLGEGAGMPIGYRLTQPYMDMVTRWIEAGSP